MSVRLIGIGGGAGAYLTEKARQSIGEAQLIIGASRMLDSLPGHEAKTCAEYRADKIRQLILENPDKKICVLYSGDTGFYSGAGTLGRLLEESGIEAEVIPGISSLQVMSARLGMPWQSWRLSSAHGVACDPVYEVMQGKPVFFLTGGDCLPDRICRELTEAGLGDLTVYIGERLTYPEEKVMRGKAREMAEVSCDPLSVLLVMPAPVYPETVPGLPDEDFIRGSVPMTKQEVRAAVLARLGIRRQDVCWDVGAGTGSVSIEMAHHARSVWAIEQKREACELIMENRKKFCAWNLHLTEGKAPEGLESFPAPSAVFIGGSSGNMADIIDCALKKNPSARLCMTAIALESLSQACSCLEERGFSPAVTQIAVSRTKPAGGLHLLMAQNPVFLITGEKP